MKDPSRELAECRQRTTIVGASLGIILGLVILAEAAALLVLKAQLRRTKEIVAHQSAVLWRIRGRET